MAWFSGLLGHATEVDVDRLEKEFEPLLVESERLVAAFRLVRDLFVFTDKRLILVDKQGVTGKKADYQTIPYGSIVRFAKESSGILDLDAELKIWVRGQPEPIVKEFKKNDSVNDVYRLLSQAVLR